MKTLIVLLAATLLSTSAYAHDSNELDYSSEVGLKILSQNLIDKKLVNQEARGILKKALQTQAMGFTKLECDTALGGIDECTFFLFEKNKKGKPGDENEGVVYEVYIKSQQGKIMLAKLRLTAG